MNLIKPLTEYIKKKVCTDVQLCGNYCLRHTLCCWVIVRYVCLVSILGCYIAGYGYDQGGRVQFYLTRRSAEMFIICTHITFLSVDVCSSIHYAGS